MVDLIGQIFFGGPKRGRPKKKKKLRKTKRKSVVRKAFLKGSRRLARRVGIVLSERGRRLGNLKEAQRQEFDRLRSLKKDFFE